MIEYQYNRLDHLPHQEACPKQLKLLEYYSHEYYSFLKYALHLLRYIQLQAGYQTDMFGQTYLDFQLVAS